MALLESSPVPISARTLVSLAGGEDDHTVVWLRGEYDASTVDKLSEVMARAIALDDADLVADLSEVQFMGAATVRAIARARECLRGRSRSLVLRSPSTVARRVVELCGLGHLVDPGQAVVRRPPGAIGRSADSGLADPGSTSALNRPEGGAGQVL